MEQEGALCELLIEYAKTIGVYITTEQAGDFLKFLHHLLEWNKVINLTSITEPAEVIVKHFIDSISILAFIDLPAGSTVLDVGTGAGFPGMPLKIVRRDLRLTFVEPSAKKTSFLQFIVGHFQFGGSSIFQGSLRTFAHIASNIEAFDFAVTRALKPELLLYDCAGILKSGGKLVLYRTAPMTHAHPAENLSLLDEYSIDLPGNYGKRTLSVLVKV